MDFETENAKTIRQAPTILNIDIKCDGVTIISLERKDIISCILSLRGVETKLDNPDLQASTIEIEAYWPGSDEDILALRGKETVIEYTCGYEYHLSRKRTFYATFDEDGITLENHLLKIKGTDLVGTITGDHKDELITNAGRAEETIDGIQYGHLRLIYVFYLYSVLDGFLFDMAGWQDGTPNFLIPYDGGDLAGDSKFFILIDTCSKRKLIAQFMNIFRGSDPDDPDKYAKRFVFRDAGIPEAGWCDDAVVSWNNQGAAPLITWEMDYDDVTDFTVEYGNAVKEVRIDNPMVDIDDYVIEEEEQITLEPGASKIVSFSDPMWLAYYGWDPPEADIDSDTLSTKAIKFWNEGITRGTAWPYYRKILRLYEQGDSTPNTVISTGIANGDVITLDELIGLHKFSGLDFDTHDPVATLMPIKNALEHALNDCGLKQPKWINFTWRGHPDMQPRDMILLTEKDETKNYYEIDNLTLEHKDGGLISKVRAIYKCPYTEEES